MRTTIDQPTRLRYTPSPHCGENNDCTVIAMSNAFDLSYETARQEMARRGRKRGRGVRTWHAMGESGEVMGRRYRAVLRLAYGGGRRITLRTFARRYPIGRYMVVVAGHCLAVINGTVLDNHVMGSDLRRVRFAWQVERGAWHTAKIDS